MKKLLASLCLLLPLPAAAQDSVTINNPNAPGRLIRLSSGGDDCHHYPGMVPRPTASGGTAVNYTVNLDGSVSNVVISSGSGDIQIDRTAIDCVKSWKFLPLEKLQISAPVTGTAIVTYANRFFHWQTPQVRDASAIALTDINGQGLKCLRGQEALAPVAATMTVPTILQIQFFRGEISRVKIISPPGNDTLDKAAVACYSAIAKSDQRAVYLDKTEQVSFNLPWNTLYPKAR